MKQVLDWDGLLASLNDSTVRLDEKGWNIFRYLSANVGDGKSTNVGDGKSTNVGYEKSTNVGDGKSTNVGYEKSTNAGSAERGVSGERLASEEARTLLLTYMKLPLERPSLLHSMMLGVALKMTETYADFKLPGFLKMWNIRNLRPEDRERQKDEKGKAFHSLAERLAKTVVRYRLTHPGEPFDELALAAIRPEAAALGFRPIMPMVAVKMWETEANGRKMRFVKLIGPKGEELSADWHLFRAKPWEIVGQMYDVLPRHSAESGNARVDSIVRSTRSAEEVFGKRIGYVDRYDEQHQHFHIFDSDSRHFVAESPKIRPAVGTYVWFCPIVPAQDKFKSAIILRSENTADARQQFGITTARVTSINREKGYFLFQTNDERQGLGDLKLSPRPLAIGDEVRLILFLKRYSRDGEKRLYVAEIV